MSIGILQQSENWSYSDQKANFIVLSPTINHHRWDTDDLVTSFQWSHLPFRDSDAHKR